MGLRSWLVKTIFRDTIQNEIRKASKQVISYTSGYTMAQGIVPDIDFEVFYQMYEQTSWIRAVVEVICKSVTSRGYILSPLTHTADQREADRLRDFFENCNPNMTISEILYDLARDVFVYGNAFVEVVYGLDGKPNEIWNLDATTMRVKADVHGTRLGYIQIPRFATAGTENQIGIVPFDVNEVIHIKLASRGSTLYGLSPMASLILPVTVDKYAQIYNRAFFVNGAKIRGAFIMKDSTPEQVERNREYLAARAKNPDLAHSDLVMEGEVEFKQIGVNQKDMEFLELREFTRNEILAVYGVPPSKVSIIDTGNIGSGTGEHQSQTFYEETILPFQIRVAEKITKHIIRQGFGIRDWAFQFNKRAIDEKDQAEIFNIYIQSGVFTPEEVRRMVSPRMHGIQKDSEAAESGEIKKDLSKAGPIKPTETLARHKKSLVTLENQFALALAKLYREIKSAVAAKLKTMTVEGLRGAKKKAAGEPGGPASGLVKQDDDLELLIEEVDADGIAKLIHSYTIKAANQGFDNSADQPGVENAEGPSAELQEWVNKNSLLLATGISDSLRQKLRQIVADGIAASETIPQLAERIERELDTVSVVNVNPILDAAGNVLRSGGMRQISAETSSKAIARTETNRAYNKGNLDALRQGKVEQVQWLLAPDACPECLEAADASEGETLGKTMDIGEADGQLPVHPNCFPGHVPIFTPEGWRKISQVRVGDKVLTHRLRFQKVRRIFSHQYDGPMIRLAYHHPNWRGDVACTPNHKFLTPRSEWKEARELGPGDSLLLLANQCAACGTLIPYWRSFCSKRCVAVEEWKNPDHRRVVAEKARSQLLREYSNGSRDRQAIVEKAHEAVRQLAALGQWRTPIMSQEQNPSTDPEVREKIRRSKLGAKNWMFGRKGPLHHRWRGGKISYRGKDWAKTCRLVKERDGFHCTACGITEEESTRNIGTPLQVHHIIPFRVKPDNDVRGLTTLCAPCHAQMERVVDRLLYNDLHRYQTMEVRLVKAENIVPKIPLMVYNLEVTEDESYIAKGFVAHNCRCTFVTVVEKER